MKLYVYCVAEGFNAFENSANGVAGRAVKVLTDEELSVPASVFDGDVVPVTRDNVLRHESVVRSVLAQTTPLPFRFGTLVTEETLRSYLQARRSALADKLRAVRGCVEMGVKIIWRNSMDREGLIAKTESEESLGIGASFLRTKRITLLGDQILTGQASEVVTWLNKRVGNMVRQEQINVRPREKMVLSVAYLVERDLLKAYRDLLGEARAERPDLHFLTSGPWPPYSFANIELEFKTHFGVS
jgi:Gas vesicle synthesis protein GvpL/GvpF